MIAPITRVCVVDEDNIFTRRLRLRLEETGCYRVREINQSRQTIGIARRFRPDVILLAHRAEGLHEAQLLLQLSQDKYLREAHVAFLASMTDRHEPRGFAFRNDDGNVYIDKSVSIDALRNCMHFDLPLWRKRDHDENLDIAV